MTDSSFPTEDAWTDGEDAKTAHADVGGSTEAMRELQEVRSATNG